MTKKTVFSVIVTFLIIFVLIFVMSSRHSNYNKYVNIIEVDNNDRNVIVMSIEDIDENEKLFFFSNSDKIRIVINNEEQEFTNIYMTKRLYSIDLPSTSCDITIYFDDIAGLLTPIDRVYVGDDLSFIQYLLSRDIILVTVTVFMFFISFLVLFLSIYYFILKSKSAMIIGYPIFFLASSIWCLTQVDFMVYLLQDDMIFYVLQQYTIFLIPISIAITSLSFNRTGKNKILSGILILTFMMISLIAFILELGDVKVILLTNYITLITTILYFLLSIIMMKNVDDSYKNKHTTVFIGSLIIIVFGLTFDLLCLIIPSINNLFGMYYTICLLFIYIFSINTIIKEYIIREKNRVHLSEENNRLSSSILLSQIKPHFLYNALNSISYLCKKDPQEADLAVIRFSRYLRQNMKCIESSELVDFDAEMEHIKNYIYLENIRFPQMEIVYELKFVHFKVPPLCIQPIVENAVKHGASKRSEGGHILIKSFATAQYINIEISDNGPGFDGKLNEQGTGLSNISRRLKMLINADIEFGSVVGRGTIVVVRIPRKEVS